MIFNRSTEPTYYNTFVQPMIPAGGGQTVSGSLQGSGPTNNFQPSQGIPYGGGQQQQNSSMTDQDKFIAAAQALGIPLNQTRGHQVEIANYLNQQFGGGWKAGSNADDWIGTPTGQGIDFSQAGSNAFQWLNDDPTSGTLASSMKESGGNMGVQANDPFAWRRQNAMRQMQRPMYGPAGSQGGPLPSNAGPMPQFGPGGGYDQNTGRWVNNTSPVGIAPISYGGLQGSAPTSYQAINQPQPYGQSRPNMVANASGQPNPAFNRMNY